MNKILLPLIMLVVAATYFVMTSPQPKYCAENGPVDPYFLYFIN